MHAFSRHRTSYLNQIEAYVARMPSLSTTATKVLETCNNPQSSPNDLNRLIALDPVLAGQVLRLINSAYYSLRHPVSSLTRAIIMLGVNTVKNLVLSFAILQQLPIAKRFGALSPVSFWEHSVAVGVIAKWLAEFKRVDLKDQEDYFVGGLLHDLGKIPLNHQFADETQQAMVLARQHRWSAVHAESIIFGFDHSMVGGLIARKWRLSPAFVNVLAYHHRPAESPENNPQLVFMVALADVYARLLENDLDEDALADDEFATLLMARVGLDASTLAQVRNTVLAEIDRAKIFLEISQRKPGHDR
ncbi:MAG: HDOD domain-containing protein [Desulfobacterales bacterium]|jgi:putative nucleotidyltransferase with HDIG domain